MLLCTAFIKPVHFPMLQNYPTHPGYELIKGAAVFGWRVHGWLADALDCQPCGCGVVPKGLLISLDFFLCRVEFSPCWALPEYIRALIHSASLRVFSVTPWVIVYRLYRVRWQGHSDWFKKIALDPLRVAEYRVSKASHVSITTAFTRHQL